MLQEGKFMKIGLELLDALDEKKTYEVQLALTLLYMIKPQFVWYGDTCIKTTASLLIKQFGRNEDINRRQQANVIEALDDLRNRGLISISGDLNFKGEIFIDAKKLIELSESKEFVKVDTKDFVVIMEDEEPITIKGKDKTINGVESLLLLTLMSIVGAYNGESIDYFKQFDDGEVAKDISHDKKLQELKFVFCNSSLEKIRSRKHPRLQPVDNWIDEDYLSAMISRLAKLGAIKITKKKVLNSEGKWTNMNFYYSPIFSKDNMDVMINSYAKRMKYAIKNKDVEVIEEIEEEQETQSNVIPLRPIPPKPVVPKHKQRSWF